MAPSNISFPPFRVIFHFHDYGRKGIIWSYSPKNKHNPWKIVVDVDDPGTFWNGTFLGDM